MLAKPVGEIPAGQLYEPKWDGFRSVIFREGDEVEIGSRNERPMTRYFPEVVAAVLANFPARAVIDGEIVIADTARNRLDFEALGQRIHPAESRVRLLAEQTPASFIAFDPLALDDVDLRERPLTERREQLERVLAAARAPVHLAPVTAIWAPRGGGSSSSRAPGWTG
jgi:ATP-dependent DNA ligase